MPMWKWMTVSAPPCDTKVRAPLIRSGPWQAAPCALSLLSLPRRLHGGRVLNSKVHCPKLISLTPRYLALLPFSSCLRTMRGSTTRDTHGMGSCSPCLASKHSGFDATAGHTRQNVSEPSQAPPVVRNCMQIRPGDVATLRNR